MWKKSRRLITPQSESASAARSSAERSTHASKRKPQLAIRRRAAVISAVHEAGHAVAAQVLGVPHDGATVEPDRCGSYRMAPNPSGETFIIDPRPGWSRVTGPKKQIAQNLAICLYAGRAAELCIFGQDVGGHERDYSEARRLILWARRENTIGLLDWRALQRRLLRRADALVRGNEAAVRRVAAALQRRGTLSREDVSELVGLAEQVARDNWSPD